MYKFISKIIITLIISTFLLGCMESNTSINTMEEQQTVDIRYNYTLSGIHQQILSENPNALSKVAVAENLIGQMIVYSHTTGLTDTTAWFVTIDETAKTITSNMTQVLPLGVYDFTLEIVDGNKFYVGSQNNVNLTPQTTVSLIVSPVLGDLTLDYTVTNISVFKFQYPANELSDITDPKLGYKIDGGAEVIIDLSKVTGTNELWINIPEGPHTIELSLYDGAILVGTSMDSQENVGVLQNQDITLDIVPLTSEVAFNMSLDGGDLFIEINIPTEVIDEVGSESNLFTVLNLVGNINTLIEDTLSFSLNGDSSGYVSNITLPGIYFDTVALELEFYDQSTNDLIAHSVVSGLVLSSNDQLLNLALDINRRALITGNILASVGVNVYDDSLNPVAGAVVSLNGNIQGITGSGAFGTSGYLHFLTVEGNHTLSAEFNGATDTLAINLSALDISNFTLNLTQTIIPDPVALLRWNDGNAINKTFPDPASFQSPDVSNAIFDFVNITTRDDNRHFFDVNNTSATLDINTAPYISYTFDVVNTIDMDRMVVHGNTERTFVLELRSSLDNFATTLGTFAAASDYYQFSSVGLTGMTIPAGTTVEFRAYVYNTTGTNLLALTGGTYFESADGTPDFYNDLHASVSFWKK